MFHHAHNLSIYGGQFIVNSGSAGLHDATLTQNVTVTYQLAELLFVSPSSTKFVEMTRTIKLATPVAPTVFIGRNELMAEAVQELCQKKQTHIAILGAGGIGKTALALHILENEAVKHKFRNKIYFVPCELFSGALSLIQGLVEALKLSIIKGHTPYETLEEHLEISQDPMLIILDNFETPWHTGGDQNAVLNLIEWMMSHEWVSIVLTMRAADGPGYRKWHKLGGCSGLPTLNVDAARKAFMLISNSIHEDVAKLDWLLKEVDCMPLAILLIAQLKKHLSLDTLIRKWKYQKTKMLKLGVAATRGTNLCTSIDISPEIILESQNSECIKILPILSFLPNGVPSWQENLIELVTESDIDLEGSVISLLESALIYEENNSLKMLSPIREYLQTRYPTKANHLMQISIYYMRMSSYHAPGRNQDVIETHSSNIIKILETQLHHSPQRNCLLGLYNFVEYGRFSASGVELIDIALSQKWDDTFEEEIRLRFAKEKRLSWMGSHERAITELEAIQYRLNNMTTQRNTTSKAKNLAKCLQRLGVNYYVQSEYSRAKLYLTNAQTQFKTIDDQLGFNQCVQFLGNVLRIQGLYSEAKLLLTDAKTQFENASSQLEVAQCVQSLGDIYRMQDDFSQAVLLLTDAKTQFENMGNQSGIARCLLSLGNICIMQDDYLEAKLLLTDAKSQFEKVGGQLGVSQCLQSLGNICIMQCSNQI